LESIAEGYKGLGATKQVESQIWARHLAFRYSYLRRPRSLEYISSETDSADNMRFCRPSSNEPAIWLCSRAHWPTNAFCQCGDKFGFCRSRRLFGNVCEEECSGVPAPAHLQIGRPNLFLIRSRSLRRSIAVGDAPGDRIPTHVRASSGTMLPIGRGLSCGRSPGVPMVRWIAFDDDTAEAVVSRLRRGAAEIQHSVPVDAALRTDGSAVLVLPSPNPGKLLVARFSTRKSTVLRPPSPSVARPAAFAPPPIRKSVESVKKPWWRKIVA
jgi:hypothetical protein